MRIRLKLFATLSDYLPSGSAQNLALVEVPDGATPHQVMDQCRVPRDQAHLVVLNGVFVLPHQRNSLALSEEDTLALWPPVAGG
jgi:molybdopterin converting factor small subunit